MARIVRNKEKWHKVTIKTSQNDGELLLVTGGKRAYLWAAADGHPCITVSGASTLRKLARAILKEVGA